MVFCSQNYLVKPVANTGCFPVHRRHNSLQKYNLNCRRTNLFHKVDYLENFSRYFILLFFPSEASNKGCIRNTTWKWTADSHMQPSTGWRLEIEQKRGCRWWFFTHQVSTMDPTMYFYIQEIRSVMMPKITQEITHTHPNGCISSDHPCGWLLMHHFSNDLGAIL